MIIEAFTDDPDEWVNAHKRQNVGRREETRAFFEYSRISSKPIYVRNDHSIHWYIHMVLRSDTESERDKDD
jgi:hypothetical protein